MNGCPAQGLRVWKERKSVRKQGGEVQSWERRSQLLGSHGVVTQGPSQSPGPCLLGPVLAKGSPGLGGGHGGWPAGSCPRTAA